MKYYILVIDGSARENIPEWNPDLPDTPIDERYPAALLEQCIVSDDPVTNGWLYDAESGEFSAPPVPELPDPPDPDLDPMALLETLLVAIEEDAP